MKVWLHKDEIDVGPVLNLSENVPPEVRVERSISFS